MPRPLLGVPRPRRAGRRPERGPASRQPRVVVVGDLMLDVVVAPARALVLGTDVPGRVSLRQGGSAATTARWLSRLGAQTTFVCSVGRDPEGRALVAALAGEGVRVRASRAAGARTGRIAVVVSAGGERSFVADRGAADLLSVDDLAASTFRADLVHLPIYSLLGEPLGGAGRRAIELARAGGALVSVDLASAGPLLSSGRPAAVALVRRAAPDVLFATSAEAEALLGPRRDVTELGDLAPLVVIKRGRGGASVVAAVGGHRAVFDVATPPLEPVDTTGAGDAFDAGFLVSWLAAAPDARTAPTTLRRAVLAAHRAAARQLSAAPRELSL